MKTGLTSAALVLVLAATLAGQQTVCIPDSNPTTGGSLTQPFNCSLSPSINCGMRFQFLVPAASLNIGVARITDLAFAPSNAGSVSATQLQIRMSHTTASALASCFDPNLGPCPTVVFDGPFKWTQSMNTFSSLGLQCGFGYDGARSLVVEIRYRNGGRSNVSVRSGRGITYRYTDRGQDPYTEACAIPALSLAGPKVCLDYDSSCVLLCPDTVKLGTAAAINIVNGLPTASYQMATALGQRPILNLGSCNIGLSVDNLFFASVTVGPPIFNNYLGTLDGSGNGGGSIFVPSINGLVGLCIYHAAATFARGNILCCANTSGMQIIQ